MPHRHLALRDKNENEEISIGLDSFGVGFVLFGSGSIWVGVFG
jgi:hypothetical protein